MKKYIAVTIIGLMTIMTTTVSAENHTAAKKKCNLGKAFVEDVDLTTEQRFSEKTLEEKGIVAR